jgi:hypothetical protein
VIISAPSCDHFGPLWSHGLILGMVVMWSFRPPLVSWSYLRNGLILGMVESCDHFGPLCWSHGLKTLIPSIPHNQWLLFGSSPRVPMLKNSEHFQERVNKHLMRIFKYLTYNFYRFRQFWVQFFLQVRNVIKEVERKAKRNIKQREEFTNYY